MNNESTSRVMSLERLVFILGVFFYQKIMFNLPIVKTNKTM